MRNAIQKMLLGMGVTPDLSGFNLLVEAIQIKATENNVKTTSVYKRLATESDSYANIERKIRHAISRVDKATVEKLFDASIPTKKERFTNEQFIALCALKIKEG